MTSSAKETVRVHCVPAREHRRRPAAYQAFATAHLSEDVSYSSMPGKASTSGGSSDNGDDDILDAMRSNGMKVRVVQIRNGSMAHREPT